MKRLLALFLSLVLILGAVVPAYATGDGNFDGGGGGMGSGTSTNYWNPGMDGVRISVVNVDSHAVVGNTVDWSNQNPSTNMIHFGKVSKLSYNSGRALSPVVPGYDRLLSAQCAPDAGFLAVVQRHAGTAWRSASLELDTERCDHGGRAARRGAPLVHPAGYSTESIQGGASANDRGFCVSGKCSRRKGRCVV